MNRLHVVSVFVGMFAVTEIALAQGKSSGSSVSPQVPAEPQAQIGAVPSTAVPAFVPFSNVLLDRSGKPIVGSVAVTLAIYAEREEGAPLWSEVQTVQADQRGNYTVTLGATTAGGLPVEIFASGQARWFAAWPLGNDEPQRMVFLSVPYALKSSDADTLGGMPASAFVLASSKQTTNDPTSVASRSLVSTSATAAAAPSAPASGTLKGSGTANFISKFLDPSTLGNSIIFENGGKIGVGTTTPGATLDVNATGTTAAVSGFNSNGMGVVGNGSDTGIFGISFTANPSGVGVRGQGSATTGPAFGVQGTTFSTSGTGVYGSANPTTGNNFGVQGVVNSSDGIGVSGQALAFSGSTIGVRGLVSSVSGAAAVFDNTAGGSILFGRVNGVDKFRVDGTGAVYATSYKDLAGNPIASGDITGVAAGLGLTGGGPSGDVTLNLNTAFTDGRYALIAHGHDVSQISNAASLAANTFAGTQTIDSGDLDLDPSTATTGNITKNGTRFLHNFGVNNTFLGAEAGNLTMGGDGNVGTGSFALRSNTSGQANVAIGSHALQGNTTGFDNTAIGEQTLQANVTGFFNTAVGAGALIGSTGSNNVAVGLSAGSNATTGSNNIYLGTTVLGVAGESNTMYLGKQGTQTTTFIAGVRGTTVTGGEPVLIDAAGRLGSGAVAPGPNSVGSAQVIDGSLTANDLAPDSVTASQLSAASVTADKVAFNYAGSTSAGGPATDLACAGCVSASEVSFSFASLGANTFSGNQTINGSISASGNSASGLATFTNNSGGVAVRGISPTGYGMYGSGAAGVLGEGSSGATGILGTGFAGVVGTGAPGAYGVSASGGKAPLRLVPGPTTGEPSGSHEAGEMYVDAAGSFYVATAAGNPATWQRLYRGVPGYEVVTVIADSTAGDTESWPAACPSGKVAIGGGGAVQYDGQGSGPLSVAIEGSGPIDSPQVWRVLARKIVPSDRTWHLVVWAVCALN